MQLDGDAERNHSFLSPRWGRLASARAFLALWPFPSLLFSTHVLLFFFFLFFYVPRIFCAMPCCLICMIHFIPIFMPLLHWTGSFQGLAHFSQGETTRMKWQVHLFVTLFSGKVGCPAHSSSSPTPRLQVTE